MTEQAPLPQPGAAEPPAPEAANGDPEGPPPTLLEPKDLFSQPLFPETFAAFLRFHPAIWRMRRVDRFTPQDLDLAEHQITIQGLIDAPLLDAFLQRRATLKLPSAIARDGDPMTVVVPAISAPKRLLLNFSSRTESGEALPMLARAEGSQIVARDLLSRLLGNSTGQIAGLGDLQHATTRLRLLLTTLVFLNPHRLAERLEGWPRRHRRLRKNIGLHRSDLERWIRQEGDEFNGGGAVLLTVLGDILNSRLRRGPVPPPARPDGLRYFATLESLLVHGVQDLLKTVVQAAEPWPLTRGETNRRAILAGDMAALSAHVVDVFEGLALLEELMRNQEDQSANAELYRHLDRWTAFAVVDIRLGVPFVMKFSQTLPLTERRRRRRRLLVWPFNWLRSLIWPFKWLRPLIWPWLRRLREKLRLGDKLRLIWTFHFYPLAVQDAVSVHAEVVIPDPELRLDRQSAVVRRLGRWRWRRVRHVFGHELRPTGRLLHRYSSRRPEETQEPTAPLFLRVQLKLIRSVRKGYAFAALAFLMAGAYVSWTIGDALIEHRGLANPEVPVTVGALAATLSLWLTTVQHRRAVVYRKLWLARRLFYIALYLILAPLVLYALRRVWPDEFYAVAHWLRPAWDVVNDVWGWAEGAVIWIKERLDT